MHALLAVVAHADQVEVNAGKLNECRAAAELPSRPVYVIRIRNNLAPFAALHSRQLRMSVNSGRHGHLETMEVQMATPTVPKPSVANQRLSAIQEQTTTTWTAPRFVEIAVGLEINSYASAERS
jgi:coenzyme PQQ precursor peptide PqqA